MNLHTLPSRIAHFQVTGCLLLTFFAGSACSREFVTASPETNPVSDQPPAQIEPEQTKPTTASAPEPSPVKADQSSADDLSIQTQALENYTKRIQAQLNEILSLYRRLHIELDDTGRSSLIVQLFEDPRLEIRNLGFELADRDLSGQTDLSPEVGEYAKNLLADSNPEIRSKAARLINRLVPLDAMIVITNALDQETDPIAAQPMLNGVARWPNPDAVEATMRWFLRKDSPFNSACAAIWSLEQSGLLDPDQYQNQIMDRLRIVDPNTLHEEGMKLIAKFGDASDLQNLVSLLITAEPNQQRWAANALVETPRAAEVLVQVAESNSSLFEAAAESLIAHRRNPEGLRRLASLPVEDEAARRDALVRMGSVLPDDQLAEAVRLADLDSEYATLLLSRLLNGNAKITPRVAKGILLLAEIELDKARPNRAFEAAIALDDVELEPTDRTKIDRIKADALIALGKFHEAYAIEPGLPFWKDLFENDLDSEIRTRVAKFMLETFSDLPEELKKQLQSLYKAPDAPAVGSDSNSD